MTTMMNLYYSMGATFLLINILYTLVLPFTMVYEVLSYHSPEGHQFWVITLRLVIAAPLAPEDK